MRRGMIYKAVWILSLAAVAALLIYPTIGMKTMEITMLNSATEQQKTAVAGLFSERGYSVETKDSSVLIKSRGLNDAVMNEARTLEGVSDAKILKLWVEEKLLAKKINLGLDLQGGMNLVLRANYEGIEKKLGRKLTEKDRSEITQQALELLRNRIDKFGVSEPSIKPSGNESIEIQLPGVKDPASVKNALGQTGRLEYRHVNDAYTAKATEWIKGNYKEEKMPLDVVAQDKLIEQIASGIKLPADLELMFFYEKDEETSQLTPSYPMALTKDVAVDGTDISETTVNQDEYGQIIVSFKTTSEGAAKFAAATAEKFKGTKLAIVLDRKIRNAPNINEPITTGSGQISGGFTYNEALTLSRIIKEGALPVDLQIVHESSVGPTLGQDSINAGVKALFVSLIGVMLFMVVYYKGAGIVSVFGLSVNILFMMALLSLLGFTLTLPGIAGFILTVGMAVDANVIIYERIKEELAGGKSVRMAVVSGYEKAFWTIFDSNLTTIISAFILFQFGTGPIKGFAVTLFIGILTSMFTALYITRFIYEIISQNKRIKKLSI